MYPDSHPDRGHGRRWALAVAALFVLLSAGLYAGVLRGPFIFDDDVNITADPELTGAPMTVPGILKAAFTGWNKSRPVPRITFILQYRLHGKNTLPYHAFNVLVHAACGILLYSLLCTTLGLPAAGLAPELQRTVAFFAAMIWLAHPLQTQTVSYIVQRMNGMAAFFYLLSLWLYARGRTGSGPRRFLLYAGCAASAVLAFGSKEWTATLPVFLFLYEWFFFQDLDRAWFLRRALWMCAAAVFLLFLGAVYLDFDISYYLLTPYKTFRSFTMSQRVLTEFRVVIFYASLFLFPWPGRLNLEHDPAVSHGLFSPPSTGICLALILACLAWAFFRARRERLLAFCVLWYFGNLAIESSVIPLELVFEHRMYLPSMFLSALTASLLFRFLKNRRAAGAVLCLFAAFCAWGTLERNKLWANDVALYEDCVNKSPDKGRARLMLGWLYTTKGRFGDALPHLEKSVDRDPKNPLSRYNLGLTLDRLGRLDEAIVQYEKTLEIEPYNASAHINLANAYTKKGRLAEAMGQAREALAIQPDNPRALLNAGQILMRMGNIRQAVPYFEKAVQVQPDYAKAHNNLGIALAQLGQFGPAKVHLEEALRLDPGDAVAHFNLGRIYWDQGLRQEAARHFSRAVQLDPRLAPPTKETR